jgi:adenylylsulfate kinase-like enzyme
MIAQLARLIAKVLKQKGCVVWITGLSGSGKQTLLSLELVCCVLLALLMQLLKFPS